MMTEEDSTKNVNTMTPRARMLVLGRGHIDHIVTFLYFFFQNIKNTDMFQAD